MKGMQYELLPTERVGEYLADPAWVVEQKLDGVRVMAHVARDSVRFAGVNDDVLTFAAAAQWFEKLERGLLAAGLPNGTVLDGELMIEDGRYWLYDLPYFPGVVLPSSDFRYRRLVLETLWDMLNAAQVELVPQARTTEEKEALWLRVCAENIEGVIAKRLDAPYAVGRRTADVVKFKVTKTIDCVVMKRNEGGNNAVLGLYRDGELVEVGRCSMIGKPDARPGEVIEVEFLYLTTAAQPRLYQPRMFRQRPDKDPSECLWHQVEGFVTNRAVV